MAKKSFLEAREQMFQKTPKIIQSLIVPNIENGSNFCRNSIQTYLLANSNFLKNRKKIRKEIILKATYWNFLKKHNK